MASSSTSTVYKNFTYDVFLSFRGEDTRTNFVDHLYYALQQKGIHTYKDDERIKKGKMINDELIRSIEDSEMYIIVFSKDYASSSWCLDELVKIMECQKSAKHKNKEAAGKWRAALKEAADLAGWELKNTADGHEAKFIQKVVKELSPELRAINISIDKKLVGMKTRINDVLSSLGTGSDDVRMIGINGIGGGGKTTLSRAIFDQISFQFEGACFVENVREISKASLSGLKLLQNQILSTVLDDQGITLSSVYDGKNMMKRRMSSKTVLLILDDVDHIEQLEALAGEPNWFKHGSIIIITTRDEQLLVAHRVKLIYNMPLLLDEEAIYLFKTYAFGTTIPNLRYEILSLQVVHYAAGLPLTIKVLGSFLCGKSELEWLDALKRLNTIPLMETLRILEISYSSLEEDYKEIFLNVACIMKGWSKGLAIKALESIGFRARHGLRVLEQKYLITIYDNSTFGLRALQKKSPIPIDDNSNDDMCLGMHDHIEEMGRNIVRRLHHEPNKHSRLWINEEIEDILANDLGTEATRYIEFCTYKLSVGIVMKGLRKMKKLRYLHMSVNDFDASKSSNSQFFEFPNALQYLCWNRYPFRSLPKTFKADNLVALEMAHSKIIQLWEGGERKVLNRLRFLDLSYSMLKTLDLELTPNIETLNLKSCRDLLQVHMIGGCLKLITIDLSWSQLRTLDLRSAPRIELVNLESCSDLVGLHMPSRSSNLKSLKLYNSKLRTLDIGLTPNLEHLDLTYCCALEELHMADKCQKLASLDISCSKLRKFDLRMTPNLKQLSLNGCSNLVELIIPNANLRKLVFLNLSGCFSFSTFRFHIKGGGSWFEFFSSILKFDYDNEDESLKGSSFAELDLSAHFVHRCPFHPENDFPKFKFTCYYKENEPLSTRNLEKLISLGMCACTNLDTFSRSICGLQRLRKLKLTGSIIEAFQDFDQLECLEELVFSSTEIKLLPNSICRLEHLKSLEVKWCSLLEKLPEDLGRLKCLKKLTLSLIKIKDLPNNICTLKHLKSLKLRDCLNLQKLPQNLGWLQCLKELTVRSTNIIDLPDSICMLKNLESLELDYCSNLEKLPEDIGLLECLKKLTLSYTKIKYLPDSIWMLKHLKSLELTNCTLLEKLPEDLGRLECLEKLDLSFCRLLRDAPDNICEMKLLKYLSLYGCIKLEKLPQELGREGCLQKLNILGTYISHLPQSLFLLKDLHINAPEWLLESCGFTNPETVGCCSIL